MKVFCVLLSAKLNYSEEDYNVMHALHIVYGGGAGVNFKSKYRSKERILSNI